MKRCKVKRWDDCGGCEYFQNILYYESYEDFNNDTAANNIKEEGYCRFHIWDIKLTKEEYENIPEWCPIDSCEEKCPLRRKEDE